MELERRLIADASANDEPVTGVAIGLAWTMVESRRAGLSHTYAPPAPVDIPGAGDLSGRRAAELAERLLSWNPLEASIGAAAVNSLLDAPGDPGNVRETIMRLAPGKVVTCVGRFPFFEALRPLAAKAYLLEITPSADELPPFAAEEVIPKSDLTVITGTALINHSLQRLLELGRDGITVVLGPTTPLSPILFEFGADILGGIRITDPASVRKSLIEGVRKAASLKGSAPVILRRPGLKI